MHAATKCCLCFQVENIIFKRQDLGFHGFTENVKRNPTVESDVIVGVVDGGIWPESESFSDEGFGAPTPHPPAPKGKWKGKCAGGDNFTCNK